MSSIRKIICRYCQKDFMSKTDIYEKVVCPNCGKKFYFIKDVSIDAEDFQKMSTSKAPLIISLTSLLLSFCFLCMSIFIFSSIKKSRIEIKAIKESISSVQNEENSIKNKISEFSNYISETKEKIDDISENFSQLSEQQNNQDIQIANVLEKYKEEPKKDSEIKYEEIIEENIISLQMIELKGGKFNMGGSSSESSKDERPNHSIALNPFSMGKYEVTNQQYCEFLNDELKNNKVRVADDGVVYGVNNNQSYCSTYTPISFSHIIYINNSFKLRGKGSRSSANYPMICVNWAGAAAFCNWKSEKEGKPVCYNVSTLECDFSKNGYRLPTEAEWEYACRGGDDNKRFFCGDKITHKQANYFSKIGEDYDISETKNFQPDWYNGSEPFTSVVGSFSANGYGIFDMCGNVFEMCNDWYFDTYYKISPHSNPQGPKTGKNKVERGGAWKFSAFHSRSSNRAFTSPLKYNSALGFRVACSN